MHQMKNNALTYETKGDKQALEKILGVFLYDFSGSGG